MKGGSKLGRSIFSGATKNQVIWNQATIGLVVWICSFLKIRNISLVGRTWKTVTTFRMPCVDLLSLVFSCIPILTYKVSYQKDCCPSSLCLHYLLQATESENLTQCLLATKCITLQGNDGVAMFFVLLKLIVSYVFLL